MTIVLQKNFFTTSLIKISLDWISSFDKAKQALITSQHNICLVDYRLGKNTGLELLQYANKIKYHTPIIILTGQAKNSLEAEIKTRKQTEANLVTAIKIAETATQAKADFLSNMSHEMRTPMHAILGYAELGSSDIDGTARENLSQYFSHITSSGHRLMKFITALLDLAELDSGQREFDMQEGNLLEIIDAVVADNALQLQDKSLTLEVKIEEPRHVVQFDTIQIMQVINGMLSNAIRYAENGQQLTLYLIPAELKYSNKHTVTAITFSITDQGVGIPEDELESIFDAFVQSTKTKTGAGGTGLGLNICKQIITRHHGDIWAENNTQGGATFSFTIPLIQTITEN